MKSFDDEYQPTSENTMEVTLAIACQQFDLLMDACRMQSIRVNFEQCDERGVAIFTDLAQDGVMIALKFTPSDDEGPFLRLLKYVKQTEGR